jgi:hypothetical protein
VAGKHVVRDDVEGGDDGFAVQVGVDSNLKWKIVVLYIFHCEEHIFATRWRIYT